MRLADVSAVTRATFCNYIIIKIFFPDIFPEYIAETAADLSSSEEEIEEGESDDSDENTHDITGMDSLEHIDPLNLLNILGIISSPAPTRIPHLQSQNLPSTSLEIDEHDEWLENSENRMTENDQDYDPNVSLVSEENFELPGSLQPCNPITDRTFLVFESNLKQLLKYCFKCGGLIDPTLTKEIHNEGSQASFRFTCVNERDLTWSTQPKIENVKGVGNVFLIAATEMSGSYSFYKN